MTPPLYILHLLKYFIKDGGLFIASTIVLLIVVIALLAG